MRHMLNTLFVLTEDAYISLDNQNVVVRRDEEVIGRVPLHTLERIVYFGYKGASPALMGECVTRDIGLSFHSPRGRFLARVSGLAAGNVLLRKEQYRISDDSRKSCRIAKNFIAGKIFNSRTVVERMKRDHPMSIDVKAFYNVSTSLKLLVREARRCDDLDVLRGIEGRAAQQYFSIFDMMILREKEAFRFEGRSKRPSIGRVNGLLSFVYTLLAHDCASAAESVGLDAYVGFLHRDRPGRVSLALDLMEELRSVYVDRFVLSVINNRVVKGNEFVAKENGVMYLSEDARRAVLSTWQEKKKDKITHPFLKEKILWGLVPYIQALLLARYIRGDLEEYPVFFWK